MIKCLACGVCLMIIAMLTCGGLASDEICADMQFKDTIQGETARVEKNTYVNMTFYLNTSKCPEVPNLFLIKVSMSQGNSTVLVCGIVIEKTTCSKTENSKDCQCLPDTKGWVRMFQFMNETGLVLFTWRWRELTSSESDKKTSINIDVFSDQPSEFYDLQASEDQLTQAMAEDAVSQVYKFGYLYRKLTYYSGIAWSLRMCKQFV